MQDRDGLPSVADVVDWYMEFQSTYRARGTVRQCRSVLRRFLAATGIGSEPIDALTLSVARDYVRRRQQDSGRRGPIRPATINVEIRTIKALCAWAVEEGHLIKHPLHRLNQLSVAQDEAPPFLEWNQIEALIGALSPTYRSMVTVASLTGLRKAELFALRWEDIDDGRQRLRVVAELDDGHRQKIMAERWIPIDGRVVAALPERNCSAYVWPGRRGRRRSVNCNRINEAIRKAARSAGITSPVSLKWLRHSFATHLIAGGAPVDSVQRLMGHRNRSTTEVYTHMTDGHLREAVERLPAGQAIVDPVAYTREEVEMPAAARRGRPTMSLVADEETLTTLQEAADSVAQTRSVVASALIEWALRELPTDPIERQIAILEAVKASIAGSDEKK